MQSYSSSHGTSLRYQQAEAQAFRGKLGQSDRHIIEPGKHRDYIDSYSWPSPNTTYAPSRMPTGVRNVLVSKSGCISIRRLPVTTSASFEARVSEQNSLLAGWIGPLHLAMRFQNRLQTMVQKPGHRHGWGASFNSGAIS